MGYKAKKGKKARKAKQSNNFPAVEIFAPKRRPKMIRKVSSGRGRPKKLDTGSSPNRNGSITKLPMKKKTKEEAPKSTGTLRATAPEFVSETPTSASKEKKKEKADKKKSPSTPASDKKRKKKGGKTPKGKTPKESHSPWTPRVL